MSGIARVITVLAGLTALSSILASALGAHAVLIAVASTTVAAVPIARSLQVRHREKVGYVRHQEWLRELNRQRLEEARQEQEAGRRDARLRAVPACADLQRRADSALKNIKQVADHVNGVLTRPIDVRQLEGDVSEISDKLYRIAELMIRRQSIAAEARAHNPPSVGSRGNRGAPGINASAGSMTAAALKAQEPALREVLDSIDSHVASLEKYSRAVSAVGDSHRDFLGAENTRRLNEEIHELRVDTPRNEIAAEFLRSDTEMIDTARTAFELAVREADLAGKALASERDHAEPGAAPAG